MSAPRRRVVLLASAAGLVATVLTGCVSAPAVPSAPPSSAAASAAPAAAAPTCAGETATYSPSTSSAYATNTIRSRGFLVAGVSADTELLGIADPTDPRNFKGFDIEMVRAVAKAIWPDDDPAKRIQFKVITAGDRIPQLTKEVDPANVANGGVDLVARVMTINCDRWKQVAFSAPYLAVAKKILVPAGAVKGDGAPNSLPKGMRICAPSGTTSIQGIDQMNGGIAVGVPLHTDCLALLRQGKVDAITGDDVILAGFQAQDPYTEVLKHAYTDVQYAGIGINPKHADFARFVNSVLQQMGRDGRWQALYDQWLRTPLNAPQTLPTPDYSRPLPAGS